jgi:hypothetical protein
MLALVVNILVIVLVLLGIGFYVWAYIEEKAEYNALPTSKRAETPFVFPLKVRYLLFGILAGLLIMVATNCFYTVDAGQRAVVLSFGSVSNVASSGLNFRVPIRDRIVFIDVKTQKAQAPAKRWHERPSKC